MVFLGKFFFRGFVPIPGESLCVFDVALVVFSMHLLAYHHPRTRPQQQSKSRIQLKKEKIERNGCVVADTSNLRLADLTGDNVLLYSLTELAFFARSMIGWS